LDTSKNSGASRVQATNSRSEFLSAASKISISVQQSWLTPYSLPPPALAGAFPSKAMVPPQSQKRMSVLSIFIIVLTGCSNLPLVFPHMLGRVAPHRQEVTKQN